MNRVEIFSKLTQQLVLSTLQVSTSVSKQLFEKQLELLLDILSCGTLLINEQPQSDIIPTTRII